MQTLALLRWLGSRSHAIQTLRLTCNVQQVPIGSQLHGIGMQGLHLETLLFRWVKGQMRFLCKPDEVGSEHPRGCTN